MTGNDSRFMTGRDSLKAKSRRVFIQVNGEVFQFRNGRTNLSKYRQHVEKIKRVKFCETEEK